MLASQHECEIDSSQACLSPLVHADKCPSVRATRQQQRIEMPRSLMQADIRHVYLVPGTRMYVRPMHSSRGLAWPRIAFCATLMCCQQRGRAARFGLSTCKNRSKVHCRSPGVLEKRSASVRHHSMEEVVVVVSIIISAPPMSSVSISPNSRGVSRSDHTIGF